MSESKHIDKLQPQQYEDIYKSDDVPFRDVSSGIVKHLVKFGIGLFAILLILSFVVKIPREVNLTFELKGGLNETIFQYPETIYIREFYREANDIVSMGDTLVDIYSHKIAGYIEEYQTWNQQLELYTSGKKPANEQTLLLLAKQINGIEKEIQKSENERKIAISAMKNETKNLELQYENAERQHQRNVQLHTQEVISDLDLETSLRDVQIAEQELISEKESYKLRIAEIDNNLQRLVNRKNELKIEIEKQKADFNYDLATIENRIELVTNKVALNYGPFIFLNNSILLTSPVNGKINLRTEIEHEVPPSEILLRIQTDSLSYYAYAEAGAKDVGQIKPGTNAVLKIKSFPHYYYGTLKAKVVSVSPSPAKDGSFPVKLEITESGKLGSRMTKGMTGTASFVIEEKPVINFVFRSFLKAVTIEDN